MAGVDDTPQIGLIWAQARGGVIGADGTMPWHLPEDLKHFSRTTKGSPVVMGRRTWESFPPKFRPLPGRTNIVITRDDAFAAEGALRARDLPGALDLAWQALTTAGPAADDPAAVGAPSAGGTAGASAEADGAVPRIWVIGGGRVYAEAMDRADLLVVTEIDLEVDGDTTAPAIPRDFRLTTTDPLADRSPQAEPGSTAARGLWYTSRTGLQYRILTYRR